MFVNDIKKGISSWKDSYDIHPGFSVKIASIDFTDADIEENVEFELWNQLSISRIIILLSIWFLFFLSRSIIKTTLKNKKKEWRYYINYHFDRCSWFYQILLLESNEKLLFYSQYDGLPLYSHKIDS